VIDVLRDSYIEIVVGEWELLGIRDPKCCARPSAARIEHEGWDQLRAV
jgi:hypothetical protein